METIYLDSETCFVEKTCATIGFFDGVHRGHLALLEQLKGLARHRGQVSTVITFERHPRQVVSTDWQPLLLTTLEEKCQLIAQAGIDLLVVLRFDARMAALSARAFMDVVLKRQLCVLTLLTGYDNRFGHDRVECFDDYVTYGRELGIDVRLGQVLNIGDGAVSSSRVRRLLNSGDVRGAADCLGRRYVLSGAVVHGEQIGRQMGFPTANMAVADNQKLVPTDGVYAVGVSIAEESGAPQVQPRTELRGVMNIGTRPTFNGQQRTLEVHLLDFSGDLYGKRLTVSFIERLRAELHFESPEELRRQMMADAEQARRCR